MGTVFFLQSESEIGIPSPSLSGAEGSAHLQVVVDVAGSGASFESHVGTGTVCSLYLNVDVGQIVERERLALSSVEGRLGLVAGVKEALTILFVALGSRWVVQIGQELVVFAVGGQLEGVLVVGEEGVVTVGEVSKGTALKIKVMSGLGEGQLTM